MLWVVTATELTVVSTVQTSTCRNCKEPVNFYVGGDIITSYFIYIARHWGTGLCIQGCCYGAYGGKRRTNQRSLWLVRRKRV
jgi:hypothetical protein